MPSWAQRRSMKQLSLMLALLGGCLASGVIFHGNSSLMASALLRGCLPQRLPRPRLRNVSPCFLVCPSRPEQPPKARRQPEVHVMLVMSGMWRTENGICLQAHEPEALQLPHRRNPPDSAQGYWDANACSTTSFWLRLAKFQEALLASTNS